MSKSSCWLKTISRQLLSRTVALVAITLIAGCVQKTPIPYMARAGDTVVIGLGGIQRNVSGEQHLAQSDLTVTITPAAGGAPVTLTPGWLFKAFPDYGSLLNFGDINGSYPFIAFDGGWYFTVQLPNDGSLPPGSYFISVTSPTGKLLNTKYANSYINEGDMTQLPLEIIAGTGGTSSYVQQFTAYANTASLDVSPSNLSGVNAVAGLQLYITYPKATYLNLAHPPIAVPYNHNPFIQLAQNTIDNGTTQTLVVMLSTQQAFVAQNQQTPLTPSLNDLALHILYFTASSQGATSTQLTTDFQIDQTRSHYYDTTGAVISTMQPVLSYKQR